MNSSESQLFCGTLEIEELNNEVSKEYKTDIKLFKIELPKYFDIVDILIKSLSPLEKERAQRYKLVKDNLRFVICRSLLKYIIANETGLPISNINFELNANNKPYLKKIDSTLFFNVSHSTNYAIIALGKYELGVDIEFIDENFNFSEILPTVFNDTEINAINHSETKTYLFYKFWTRKEAIIKAIGKGIDDDISKIPTTNGLHTVSSKIVSDFKKINTFSFDISPKYIGALALTENTDRFMKVRFYSLPEPDELARAFKTT